VVSVNCGQAKTPLVRAGSKGLSNYPSTATTAKTFCTWFTAEGFAVAHHGFCRLDSALTAGVALALDEICRHGEYRAGTVPFYV
jgi:hypothetical protein